MRNFCEHKMMCTLSRGSVLDSNPASRSLPFAPWNRVSRMTALRIVLCAGPVSLGSFAVHAQPATVTATCKDGTDWSGKTRSGAGSRHGGVKAFGAAAVKVWVKTPTKV